MNINLPTHEGDPRLFLEEAAALARVSVPTVQRWIGAGLPALRSGRVLIYRSDLLAWMERGKATTFSTMSTTDAPNAEVAGE